MNANQAQKLAHLEWAIESRSHNQRCAVSLLRLFVEHTAQWNTKKWASAAQELLSVSFSLWRAAFLADKTATRSAVFSHAKDFLEKIIEDNAISYVQDRKCNEWTFNYYTRNARAALESLNKHWPKQVPAYTRGARTPTERWRYCQDLLDAAVKNFKALARDIQDKANTRTHAGAAPLTAKAKRRGVRELTLAARKANLKSD
jgi:hypothetical protein